LQVFREWWPKAMEQRAGTPCDFREIRSAPGQPVSASGAFFGPAVDRLKAARTLLVPNPGVRANFPRAVPCVSRHGTARTKGAILAH